MTVWDPLKCDVLGNPGLALRDPSGSFLGLRELQEGQGGWHANIQGDPLGKY